MIIFDKASCGLLTKIPLNLVDSEMSRSVSIVITPKWNKISFNETFRLLLEKDYEDKYGFEFQV